jgi:hypothetical protein
VAVALRIFQQLYSAAIWTFDYRCSHVRIGGAGDLQKEWPAHFRLTFKSEPKSNCPEANGFFQ